MKLVALLSLALIACAHGVAFSSISCRPPEAPAASACSQPTEVTETFAIDRLLLGDTTRDGRPAEDAWRTYGYDLDRTSTVRDSTDVCKRAAGAPPDAQVDGDGGIDNGWGHTVLPFIEALFEQSAPSQFATDAIRGGGPTLEITVHGLSDDRAQTAVGLSAEALLGAPLAGPITFDASTEWPVAAASLVDGATLASGALVHFGAAYVNGGVFVSGGSEAPLVLDVAIGGALFSDGTPAREVIELAIHHAVITFTRASRDAVDGTIAGVLDVDELVATAALVAHRVAPSLCGSAGFDILAVRLHQAADILVDGTNTAGVPCNGISLGIGFTARRVATPTTVVAAARPADPCAP